jgi:hypothetical protein
METSKMAIAKSSGADYSVPPNVKNSGAVNNHGSSARATTSSKTLQNVSVSRSQTNVGSLVIDGPETDKALSAGVIAYNNTKPVAMRTSTTIAAQANTVLLNGADLPGQVRSIAKRESYKVTKTATGLRTNHFNRVTGKWDNGYPASGTETPGTDVAATPTRTAPGQLTYKLGQPIPVANNDYKAKTG